MKRKGKEAEKRACQYLQKKGLKLLQSNFTTSLGEIDLIMRDQTCLVFVEVRYRKTTNFGSAIETVLAAKKKRLIRTALFYLQQHHLLNKIACRFDIIGLNSTNEIKWIKNAFVVM